STFARIAGDSRAAAHITSRGRMRSRRSPSSRSPPSKASVSTPRVSAVPIAGILVGGISAPVDHRRPMTDSHPRRGPRGGGDRRDRRGGRPRGHSGVDDPAARQRALATLHESLDHGNDPEVAARAALAVSEECVEAWLLLADFARSAMEARDLVRRAVETATHVLGEAGLREGRGRLGATADGVAYLHALAALARSQVGEDRAAQAIQTLEGLLAMDPADPVGVRGDLLLLLLAEARDDEAEELVSAYPE